MGNRGYNAGGFAYMPLVQCEHCGTWFRIGNKNPRRECANKEKCMRRRLEAGKLKRTVDSIRRKLAEKKKGE